MFGEIERRIAKEIACRAARRLEILRSEEPELLADRLAGWDAEALADLLNLTRLPDPLADREPSLRHRGVSGVDYCTDRLVGGESGEREAGRPVRYLEAEVSELDDDDLLAARRYIPETLPGNVLG